MWKQVKTQIWVVLFGILGVGGVWGQDPVAIRFTEEDGLPSSEVYDAMQDAVGNIWFATDHGISRFDGYAFENFTTEDGLSDNTVFEFAADSGGKVWMRCFNGSLSYLEDGKIHPYAFNDRLQRDLGNSFVETFYIDQLHDMYFTQSQLGSATEVLHLGTGRVDSLRFPTGPMGGLVRGGNKAACIPIISLDRGSPRGGEPGGVLFCNGNEKYWRLVLDSVPPEAYSRNACIARMPGCYVGIFAGRLYQIEGDRLLHRRLPARARGLSKDREGNVWLTSGKGMMLLGQDLEILDTLFENEVVHDVLQDRNGSFWISTTEGVLMVRDIHNRLYDHVGDGPRFGVRRMRNVDEKLYFYRPHGGIGSARISRGALEWAEEVDFKINYGALHDFCCLPNGRGLLLSDGLIASSLDTLLPSPARTKLLNGFPWQYRIQGDRLYVATNKGYLVHDLSQGTIVLVHRFDSTGIVCTSILEDGCGNIWVGTNHGLLVDRESNAFFHRSSILTQDQRVTDMALLDNGLMMVATRGAGLYLLEDGELRTHIGMNNGLPSNMCNRLFAGASGLWVCSDKGLSLIRREDLDPSRLPHSNPLNFGILDGLPTEKVNDVLEYKGYAIVATDRGIVTMRVPTVARNFLIPQVHALGLKAGGRMVVEGDALSVEEDNLEFHFEVGAVPSTKHLMYRYRLEGHDYDWRITRERSVHYDDLQPGDYTFRVAAFYADHPHDLLETRRAVYLPFKIHETDWFSSLAFGLVLLLVWLGFRQYFQNRNRRITSNLHRLQAEISGLRSQMQPHFVFNALCSIQHLMLIHDNAKAQQHLVGLAQLMRAILEATRQESISISEELEILKAYLELEQLRFGDGIKFVVELQPGIDWSRQLIPPMLLQPLVENAIWHGLQMQKIRPTLTLRFHVREGYVVCEVEDNGIGREAAARLEKRTVGTSIALANIAERIRLINRMRIQPITLETVDLRGEDNAAVGTCVKLHLPLER